MLSGVDQCHGLASDERLICCSAIHLVFSSHLTNAELLRRNSPLGTTLHSSTQKTIDGLALKRANCLVIVRETLP